MYELIMVSIPSTLEINTSILLDIQYFFCSVL